MVSEAQITKAYALAKEAYARLGVNTDKALAGISRLEISMPCWQGDDVGGFEASGGGAGGGTMATGNYPGKARTADELRADFEKAISLIPGKQRFSLHAIYAETGGAKIDRDELEPRYFARWIDWAKKNRIGVDFNPTFFSHPLAADNFTLSHKDEGIRKFWVRHGIVSRQIGAAFGKALGKPCVTNHWIPDGYKDTPVDRMAPRKRLKKSLDEMFAVKVSAKDNLDAIESKVFGIGVESYTVGSHDFYMGYAVANQKLLTLDSGHFHPTESVADKISSLLLYVPELLLHVSRGVRWDSDHVVTLSDDLKSLGEEIVRSGALPRIHIGLDYFDASINRVAAWVIGARSMSKALLLAMLEPTDLLKQIEAAGDYTARLAMLEEVRTLPFGAVWDQFCLQQQVPTGAAWFSEVKNYERKVLAARK
jgi:L-rhamnose isomerase